MAYDFKPFEKKIAEAVERLTRDFAGVRTGRATPAILDGIMVESYGARVNIQNIASVGVEDARTLRISPWDSSMNKEIEKAIMLADLGLSTSVDDRGVRVSFPELTGERRLALIKIAKEKLEDARAHLRSEREEVWGDIQKQERDGEMSEDEKFRAKDEMQKRVDQGNAHLEELFNKKEKEIAG